MHIFVTPASLDSRREALNLTVMRFIRLLGLPHSTWRRALQDGSFATAATARKVEETILGDEKRMIKHLVDLHPELVAEALQDRMREVAA
jgi:hypothetical protein